MKTFIVVYTDATGFIIETEYMGTEFMLFTHVRRLKAFGAIGIITRSTRSYS